ncbi:Cytochrome bo(3) ubiquinol oxidase subunit 3 [Candidatus Erwinia haradaeae]|uniref:Cytochrome bo(3) ubiquinol oxidase subunit 3 n=1 Tax=Candidatus Erwinia haradaeae TaxID=1922217 RepID=A0A451DL51_9GAMM|nr:cytochrome o ubiquinol oxidase subunit III [Candidatus Erwinia haradaeae]VFP87456.1 Cytochrome bo(3) ubiquinol oxidase subunit 3 [Candidatus Erwinia haradaeae]
MLTKNLTTHQNVETNKIFGFWLYLMSDCIIFATLFATYGVIVNNIANGPTGKEFFNLPCVLFETILLLLSSVMHGLAIIHMNLGHKSSVITYLTLTFLFALGFIAMEGAEFFDLFSRGITPHISAFLSGFFTLVGTHGLHVLFGMLWMLLLIFQISTRGLTETNRIRLTCLSLFWHFLDIVWICVFTIVYLIGEV